MVYLRLEYHSPEGKIAIKYICQHICCMCRSAEDNYLSSVEAGALSGARALRTLRLARNQLRDVPAHALAPLHRLQTLYVIHLYTLYTAIWAVISCVTQNIAIIRLHVTDADGHGRQRRRTSLTTTQNLSTLLGSCQTVCCRRRQAVTQNSVHRVWSDDLAFKDNIHNNLVCW